MTGQADGIQPRTIEVLQVSIIRHLSLGFHTHMAQSYGLADRLLKEACQMHMAVRL